MTDLEMTKKCAWAMGYLGDTGSDIRADEIRVLRGAEWGEQFDPLHNDAQAMVLVKKFRLHCNVGDLSHERWLVAPHGKPIKARDDLNLNRAIVECVANLTP